MLKVCGLTLPDQMMALDRLGVDYLGMIFYPKSPRYIVGKTSPRDIPTTRAQKVGIFVDEPVMGILTKLTLWGLDAVQLYGTRYTVEDLITLQDNTSVWISRPLVAETFTGNVLDEALEYADRCVFETPTVHHGGSGILGDWSVMRHYKGKKPFLLSGGIGLETLADLQKFTHPHYAGVDINSRFEVSPGVKDIEKIAEFMNSFREMRHP